MPFTEMPSSIDEKVAWLRRCPVMSVLGPTDLKAAAQQTRVIECPQERCILREGKPARFVYSLIEGGVRVYHRGPDGEEVLVRLFAPPAFFGEIDVMRGREWMVSAETVRPSVLLEVPRQVFWELLRTSLPFTQRVLFDVSTRFMRTSMQVRSSLTEPAAARLASFFLDHAALFGESAGGDRVSIAASLNQSHIARSLALSRKTVQRLLAQWSEAGWVVREGRRYVLEKPDELRRLVPDTDSGIAHPKEWPEPTEPEA